MTRINEAEEVLAGQLADAGIAYQREYPFAKPAGRRFRADFYLPDHALLCEVDGGVYLPGGGRHQRAAGFQRDLEKLNLATRLGYRVLRFTPQQVNSLEAIRTIRALIEEAA